MTISEAIFTGFLGTEETTLLIRDLNGEDGVRDAVLGIDFASINTDGGAGEAGALLARVAALRRINGVDIPLNATDGKVFWPCITLVTHLIIRL